MNRFNVCFCLFVAMLCCAIVSGDIEMPKEAACKRGTFACHTCLGYDMEDCKRGRTCCHSACFKVLDTKHNLVAKGCTDGAFPPKKPTEFDTRVPLPQSNNEPIKGLGYFCQSDFCNRSPALAAASPLLVGLVAMLAATVARWR